MLTTKEAAQRLGLKTTGAVRQLILAGRLKAKKIGRDWHVDETSVEEFKRQPVGRPKQPAVKGSEQAPRGQGDTGAISGNENV